MRFTLTINCDNAAFDNENREQEVFDILGMVRGLVLDGDTEGTIRDSNGNTVGKFELS